METLGKRIARLRGLKGWTQDGLAEASRQRWGKAGFKLRTIGYWENDKGKPSQKALAQLAELLDTAPEALLSGKTAPAAKKPPAEPEAPGVSLSLPIVARAAADHLPGRPALSVGGGQLNLNFNPEKHFSFDVTGRSMWPLCNEGDRVIAEKCSLDLGPLLDADNTADPRPWLALNHKVVLAELDDSGELLLKRLEVYGRKETGFKVILRSDNPAAKLYEVSARNSLRIHGVAVAILKDPNALD